MKIAPQEAEQAEQNTTEFRDWTSFRDFIEKILVDVKSRRDNAGGMYVFDPIFRGQLDSFELRDTLERTCPPSCKVLDYYERVWSLRSRIESLAGQHWRLPSIADYEKELNESGFPFNAILDQYNDYQVYSYFAYLRHHGFPSPLLDWTRSPYVAAFFAMRARPDGKPKQRAVYVGRRNSSFSGSSDNLNIVTLGPNVPAHPRHFRQQSEYSVCITGSRKNLAFASHRAGFNALDTSMDSNTHLRPQKIIIPESARPEFLEQLRMMNVNSYTLFGGEDSLMETLADDVFG